MAKSPDLKNKSLSSRNKARIPQGVTPPPANDGHNHGQQPPHIQIRVPTSIATQQRTPSGSPPSSLTAFNSKPSKSKRFTDPHEIVPLTWKDYVWLAGFYVGLYLFFVIFWFLCWYVYLLFLPEKGYRYTSNDFMGMSDYDGSGRSSNVCVTV